MLIPIIALVFLLIAETAGANSILAPGTATKGAAGAGVTGSRGSAALHYNPANLSLSKPNEVHGELAIIHIDYKYTFPGYDPVRIKETVPMPFVGWSTKLGRKFSFSFTGLAIPDQVGTLKITNLPSRQIGETPLLVDAETGGDKWSAQAGIGAAYTPIRYVSFGISALHNDTGTKTNVTASDAGDQILSEKRRTRSTTGWLGINLFSTRDGLHLGIAYKPVTTIRHRGDFFVAQGPKNEFDYQNKSASELALGAEVTFGAFAPFVELRHERHAPLRYGREDSLGQKLDADHYNVTNQVYGLRARIMRRHEMTAAYGIYPTHIGDGVMATRSEQGNEVVGMNFQDFDAMQRKAVSVGYQWTSRPTVFDFSTMYQYGKRSVPEYSRGHGEYNLKVLTMSAGIRMKTGH